MSVTLCVLFNHPYPDNIIRLRNMLKGRFNDIVFVQPMLTSSDTDVITSYRGSYNFHGLIVDASKELLDRNSDIIVFMQDDILLNPKISQDNIARFLKLSEGGAFLPAFNPLGGDVQQWDWTASVIWKLFYASNVYSGSGAENIFRYLPDANLMRSQLESKYKFNFKPISYDRNIPILKNRSFNDFDKQEIFNRSVLDGLFATARNQNEIDLPYPLCHGMSDFFAVDRPTFQKLIPILGVFAAAQMFAEVAIPTALASVAAKVVQSTDIGLYPDWVWGEQRDAIDAQRTSDSFNRELLLVHPVKLSKDMELAQEIIQKFSMIK